MAPGIASLKHAGWCDCIVAATGQHRELPGQVCKVFGLVLGADLTVMVPEQGLTVLRVRVTGNTAFDALHSVERADHVYTFGHPWRPALISTHRQESFGSPLYEISRAVARVAAQGPEVDFLFTLHPDPNVRAAGGPLLAGLTNVTLSELPDYLRFVAAMRQSYPILPDSGGVQEGAPALAEPGLAPWRETERREAVVAVGASPQRLGDEDAHAAMARGVSPYDDAEAAGRIECIFWEAFAP